MIELRRASAGSGKTYTLAKTFISLFIGTDTPDGRRRLRTNAELRDSLPHIMGVTFTNKATNEMKARIVEKLADLSRPDAPADTAYLSDFLKEFDTTQPLLARTCRMALSELLHNYSDFQISTIDSFFQSVLRAFTYETELNQNYQVEIDDNYMALVGVSDTLGQIKESGSPAANIRTTLRSYIRKSMDEGKQWNVFDKARADKDSTLFGRLLGFARQIGREEFKAVEEDLRRYFEAHPDFAKAQADLTAAYRGRLSQLAGTVRERWDAIASRFADAGIDISRYGSASIKKFAAWMDSEPDCADLSKAPAAPKATKNGVFDSKSASLARTHDWADLIEPLADAYAKWADEARIWNLFSSQLHLFGLLQPIVKAVEEFRRENNLVQLSDTNTILQRIINRDDTPFIYEKTGYYLHHFLIDEFQDTSRLQWANLRPLLEESTANGRHNLIIGDAKQSIYRFRNADPDLITHQVADDFGDICTLTGTTPAENTNWRSASHIVRFNNTLYSLLSARLDAPGRDTLRSLYSSGVQKIHKEKTPGYVRITMNGAASTEEYMSDAVQMTSDTIQELLGRGWRQKDIAVLVRSNRQGERIISTLLQLNEANRDNPEYRQVAFVSEESLKVGASYAVKTIVSALSRMALAELPGMPEQEVDDSERINTEMFERRLRHYESEHPELSASEALRQVLEGRGGLHSASDAASGSPGTLPALVERIVAKGLRDDIRRAQACFISAFQDIVLDYCEVYPTDISSFLKWWRDNSYRFAVQSPEGSDAVRVMTIHKAKGLEFPCVIMPFAGSVNSNASAPICWVEPDFPAEVREKCDTPSYLPISLSKKATAGTPYEALCTRFDEQTTTDELNALYVGTTRAVTEMHICVWDPETGRTSKYQKALSALLGTGRAPEAGIDPALGIDPADWSYDPDTRTAEYGSPLQNSDESDGSDKSDNLITDYFVNPAFNLYYRAEAEDPLESD